MTRREYNRRMRRIKAQVKRAAVIAALVLSVILMICGCLYIGEHLFQKEEKVEAPQDQNQEQVPENNDAQPVVEDPVPDTDTLILETYNYQYVKPDASGLHLVLDAGHGGNDPGTEDGVIVEKDINLTITKRIAELLKESGATVTMVRETDEYLSLEERSYAGNQTTADLFLSLHCNSFADDTSISGLEAYYHKNSQVSKDYAENLTQALKDSNTIYVRNASKQNMQVLRNSAIPAVMVEMGFLTNPEECARLTDPLYQEFLARLLTEKVVGVLKPAAM